MLEQLGRDVALLLVKRAAERNGKLAAFQRLDRNSQRYIVRKATEQVKGPFYDCN